MPVLKKLKELFDGAGVPYEIHDHPVAFTAQEVASSQHLPPEQMAKVVILRVDGELTMAVVPANQKIDLKCVRESLGAKKAELAREDEFVARFPECDAGAMPPIGRLFGMPVVVDPSLGRNEHIYFNAGNHLQIVRMRFEDFARLAEPRRARLVGEKKIAA